MSNDEVVDAPVGMSLGSSPRIVPRPKYPPLNRALMSFAKECFWVSGVLGTFLIFNVSKLLLPIAEYMLKEGYGEAHAFAMPFTVAVTICWLIFNVPFHLFDTYGVFSEFKLHRSKGQIASTALVVETVVTKFVGIFLFYGAVSDWIAL